MDVEAGLRPALVVLHDVLPPLVSPGTRFASAEPNTDAVGVVLLGTLWYVANDHVWVGACGAYEATSTFRMHDSRTCLADRAIVSDGANSSQTRSVSVPAPQ